MGRTEVTPFSWGGSTPGHIAGEQLGQAPGWRLHPQPLDCLAFNDGISTPGFHCLQTAACKPDPSDGGGRKRGLSGRSPGGVGGGSRLLEPSTSPEALVGGD